MEVNILMGYQQSSSHNCSYNVEYRGIHCQVVSQSLCEVKNRYKYIATLHG